MQIEKLGVRITDVPLLQTIVISTTCVEIGSTALTCTEVEEMRDALNEALTAYYELSGARREAVHGFAVDQVLTGDEELPLGTIVVDGEQDRWKLGPHGWGTSSSSGHATDDGVTPLHKVVMDYTPVTIIHLPDAQ